MAGKTTISKHKSQNKDQGLALQFQFSLTDTILRLLELTTLEHLMNLSCQKEQGESRLIKSLFRNRRTCLKFKRNLLAEAKVLQQIQSLPTTCSTLLAQMVFSRHRHQLLNLQVSKLIKHILLKSESSITRQLLNGCTFCHLRHPTSKSVTRKKAWFQLV
jgi:hypothetical protein